MNTDKDSLNLETLPLVCDVDFPLRFKGIIDKLPDEAKIGDVWLCDGVQRVCTNIVWRKLDEAYSAAKELSKE